MCPQSIPHSNENERSRELTIDALLLDSYVLSSTWSYFKLLIRVLRAANQLLPTHSQLLFSFKIYRVSKITGVNNGSWHITPLYNLIQSTSSVEIWKHLIFQLVHRTCKLLVPGTSLPVPLSLANWSSNLSVVNSPTWVRKWARTYEGC